MTGFDSQDRTCRSEVCLGSDGWRGSEVGSDSDVLKDTGKSDERLDISGWEGVGAFSHWNSTCCGKGLGQKLDVLGLISGNFLEIGEERVWESSGDELGLGVVGFRISGSAFLSPEADESDLEGDASGKSSPVLSMSQSENSTYQDLHDRTYLRGVRGSAHS